MGAPLFILSFRHRDELSRLAESAGWQPIAARRADNVEARFIASGAAVAVIDARCDGEEADSASWRWQPGSRTVELSPALARQAGLGEEEGRRISLMDLFRKLDPAGRRAARDAIDRLLATGEATAFAHGEGAGRI